MRRRSLQRNSYSTDCFNFFFLSEKPSTVCLMRRFCWVQIGFFFADNIMTRHRPLCDILFSYGDGIILLYTECTIDAAVHMYNNNTRIVLKLCAVCVSPVAGIQQLALEQYVYNILYNNISNTVYDQEVFSNLARKVYQKVFELAER